MHKEKFPIENRRKTSVDHPRVHLCITCILLGILVFLSSYDVFSTDKNEVKKSLQSKEKIQCTETHLPTAGVSQTLNTKISASVDQPVEKSDSTETAEQEEASFPKKTSLGTFRITGYDTCEKCCGMWAKYNRTFTGTIPTVRHTVAVDPQVIPLGSVIEINGISYVAEDTGNFSGRLIDIYFNNHSEIYSYATQYGDYAEVFMLGD